MDWFDALIKWLKSYWEDFEEYLGYLPIELLDGLLKAVTKLLKEIPVPEFISDGLQSAVNDFPPMVKWLIAETQIELCLQIILAAVLFRISRKFLTLGWW